MTFTLLFEFLFLSSFLDRPNEEVQTFIGNYIFIPETYFPIQVSILSKTFVDSDIFSKPHFLCQTIPDG